MDNMNDSVVIAPSVHDNISDGAPATTLLSEMEDEQGDRIIKNTLLSTGPASEPSDSTEPGTNKDTDNIESKPTDTNFTIPNKGDSSVIIEIDKELSNDLDNVTDRATKVDVPDTGDQKSPDLDSLPEVDSVQAKESPPIDNTSESAKEDVKNDSDAEKAGDKNASVNEKISITTRNSLTTEIEESSRKDFSEAEKNTVDDIPVSPPTKKTSEPLEKPSSQTEKNGEESVHPNVSRKSQAENLEDTKREKSPQSPIPDSMPTEQTEPVTTAYTTETNDITPEDESTLNLSEAGDEEQVMHEFLHVSAKEKDLDDPMSLDGGEEESMEVGGQTEEDPFGLPDMDTKIPDEPMDVDETFDKEKTQELSDGGEKDGDDSKDADGEEKDGDDSKDTDGDIIEPAVEAPETGEEPPEGTENLIEDVTNADGAAVANTATNDEEFPSKDADEEICIIPDTIRVPPPGTPATTPIETAKETVLEKKTAEAKAGEDSLFDSLKESEVKGTDGKKKKDDNGKETATSTPDGAPNKEGIEVVEVLQKPALSVNKDVVTVRLIEKERTNAIDCSSDDIMAVAPSIQTCFQCKKSQTCKFQVLIAGQSKYVCDGPCTALFRTERNSITSAKSAGAARSSGDFTRKCAQCTAKILEDEKNLSWETMDFCNEDCLGKYQTQLGSHCANCKGAVVLASLGKYCVRFGYDIKQFCCSLCLEEFKKGLKVCSYCQKDISNDTDGFLAPVGDKGQFKDFCTQKCMEKYDYMSNNQPPPTEMQKCDVCTNEKIVRVEVIIGLKLHKLCSDPCFAVFKFVNKVDADQCEMCKKYFDKVKTEMFSVYYNDGAHDFCSKTCMNVYILANRKIVPCNWCKVKKYNFDMIKRVSSGHVIMMCSLNCLMLFKVSVSAVSSKKIKCDYCMKHNQAQYHLTMSDATVRNFCHYDCVMAFQGQYAGTPPLQMVGPGPDKQVIPTGQPKRNVPRRSIPQNENSSVSTNSMPVISSVKSLAPNGQQASQVNSTRAATLKTNNSNVPPPPPPKPQVVVKQQVVITPAPQKEVRNKSTSCKPIMTSKGVSCRPTQVSKECQTDDSIGRPIFIPVPIPIFVPAPMHMFSIPFPMPVPFPLPVPVPMFIPTTRSSAKGILKDIKRIREKMPTDPFEAELLMMAEMVAGEKKVENSDSDSDDGDNGAGDINEVPEASSVVEEGFSPEAVDTSNFGEDMLQMALKMASELDEPPVDLEESLTPSTITAQSSTVMARNDVADADGDDDREPVLAAVERLNRGRKRAPAVASRRGSMGSPSKRGRRMSSSGGDVPLLPPPDTIPAPRVEVEKPDANMCLKYTFGVNAWRQWVNVKNAEIEKSGAARKTKLFKPEILQLTSDELNYSLCLFVKEVRKPNNTEYAPDTIYYLVLGIQQYLFENGRIDNIFTDSYYEKFTECLDEVAKKFSLLFNHQQYIVTRVEEEHLWESKQLGAHSPHVLLSTLMFFNTKHFNLTTVEEHMQLSFSHIMKHWKRNPNQPGATKVPGSRNVLLRFYPPQAALEANSRKKKVYEQQENEDNPLRCPVKLYEFYLSKCPESVKTRNDVFYLLPERSCVPDSPVWYSTMALGKEPLMKMLHRVKMVKEINMALLTS